MKKIILLSTTLALLFAAGTTECMNNMVRKENQTLVSQARSSRLLLNVVTFGLLSCFIAPRHCWDHRCGTITDPTKKNTCELKQVKDDYTLGLVGLDLRSLFHRAQNLQKMLQSGLKENQKKIKKRQQERELCEGDKRRPDRGRYGRYETCDHIKDALQELQKEEHKIKLHQQLLPELQELTLKSLNGNVNSYKKDLQEIELWLAEQKQLQNNKLKTCKVEGTTIFSLNNTSENVK